MKKIFGLILTTAFLWSCGDSSVKEETVKKSDTLAPETKFESSMSFDSQSFKALQFPLVLDTVFVEKADSNDRISYQQLRAQGLNFLKNELGERIEFTLDDFIKIDSIKHAGNYAEYIEKLDIGMAKRAIAYKIGVLNFKNNTSLFIWAYQIYSFEACPVFSYNQVVGTYVDGDKKSTHFLLAEVSGGADPPATGDDRMWATIKEDGTIVINSLSVNDDLDIPGQDITTQTIHLSLLGSKIEVTKNEKKENKGEKAPPNE